MQVADLEECPTLEPDLKNFVLFPNDDEVLVIWDWKWSDCDNTPNDDDDPEEITVIPETPPEPESDSDTDTTENNGSTSLDEIEHRVTFKCIGCTKEQPYQQALIRAAQLRREGTKVEVKVEPEPTNPFDAKAIQVKCKVDGEWKRIGYLVSEVLDEVHKALNTNRIVSVDFEWIKLIVVWRTPGWYAGVNITRKGEWSKTVLISQSART